MPKKEYIERERLTEFRNEVMGKFIELCWGNDYNKLTLLKIGDTIDSIYEKHSTQPTADVAEVVRCKKCIYNLNGLCDNPNNRITVLIPNGRINHTQTVSLPVRPNHFCGYGKRGD